MDRLIYLSEVTENSLIQTFGRDRNYQEKKVSNSERNHFQLARMNDHHTQPHNRHQISNQATFRKDPQSKSKADLKESYYHPKGPMNQFDHIDQINSKIHSLIKSISASCQKRQPLKELGMKNQKISQQKPKKLQSKYLDQQKTEKKKSLPFHLHQNSKASFFQENIHNSDVEKVIFRHKFNKNHHEQEEQYDGLNERIKKINDKINCYQKKIEANYDFNRKNIKLNDHPRQNQKSQLKNTFNSKRPQQKQIKSVHDKQINKKQQNQFNFTSSNQNNKSNQKSKLKNNDVRIVQIKENMARKNGYFNEKYIEIQKDKKEESGVKGGKDITTASKSVMIATKQKKWDINKELLSYKTTFLKEIMKQVFLDQDFRHAKHMFGGIQGLFDGQNYKNQNEKWKHLQCQLKKQGFNFNIDEVLQIFMPRDDQIDPFMSVSQSHQELIHGLIFAYQQSERNWNQNIYHGWTFWELKQAKFTSENLDLSKKGYITLEDLTFYLNSEVDGSFRNRDLLLIFNRFKSKNQPEHIVKFKGILDKLLSI